MHPTEMIFYWAKTKPQQLAVVQSRMVLTYRGLAEGIESASRQIERCGFDRHEPVAVAINDPAKLLTVCFALLRNGISCAPINRDAFPHLPANNINNLIFEAESDVLIGGRNIRFEESWLRTGTASRQLWDGVHRTQAAATNMIFFTSGTTGSPKKLVIPSAAMMERINLLAITGETNFSKVLIAPGMASLFGFLRAATMLYAGNTIFFAADTSDPLRVIETFGIEMVVASPQQALTLAELTEKARGHRLDSLRQIRVGGGFSSRDLAQRIQSRLCRQVATEYGATEAGLVAFANHDLIADIPNAVGVVVPNVRLEIVDEANNVLPVGEEGLVRGQSNYISKVFAANRPEQSAEADNAWWYPGDLGRLHEGRILCIGGRTDDIINCGGVKLSAVSLDEMVCRQRGVRDGAVCAVSGQSGIDEIWIAIVTDGQEDKTTLKQAVEESQRYQIRVGEILAVEKIPRNSLGKLQRHELKALLLGMKNRMPMQAEEQGP